MARSLTLTPVHVTFLSTDAIVVVLGLEDIFTPCSIVKTLRGLFFPRRIVKFHSPYLPIVIVNPFLLLCPPFFFDFFRGPLAFPSPKNLLSSSLPSKPSRRRRERHITALSLLSCLFLSFTQYNVYRYLFCIQRTGPLECEGNALLSCFRVTL